MGEREPLAIRPETDLLLMRAVRSLAWNQMVLPIIQARLERAESIVRSQLLLNGEGALRVGPYEVSLGQDEAITLTRLESDGWQQLRLPELDDPAQMCIRDRWCQEETGSTC